MLGVDRAVFARIEDAYVMADESDIKAEETLVIPKGMVSSVLVKVEPGASPAVVGGEIRKRIPGAKTITPYQPPCHGDPSPCRSHANPLWLGGNGHAAFRSADCSHVCDGLPTNSGRKLHFWEHSA